MPNQPDISIVIHFEGSEPVSYRELNKALDAVSTAILRVEQLGLERLREAFPQIPSRAFAVALDRMHSMQDLALVIEEANPGSLRLKGAAVTMGGFLLLSPAGEAFLESDFRDALVDYMRYQIDEKARDLTEYLNEHGSGLHESLPPNQAPMQCTVTTEDGQKIITIRIPPQAESLPTCVDDLFPGEGGTSGNIKPN